VRSWADSPLLAIETSCDDTCAAVVSAEGQVLSNVISSQARFHERYGGVVPEVASRHHLELVNAVVEDALDRSGLALAELGGVAATSGPGLIGALLIGLSTAKALAAAQGLPFAAVDHLQGHVAANFLLPDPLEPPFLCLIASVVHSLLSLVAQRSG
jgi:N6-L-threonylcarbamoyladenine synthase